MLMPLPVLAVRSLLYAPDSYYPVNAAAYIKDNNAQLTVLVDRSQGVYHTPTCTSVEGLFYAAAVFDAWCGVRRVALVDQQAVLVSLTVRLS